MNEIPLHLLPQAVGRQVRDWGDAVYRISVRRTHWHLFNMTVRTKPVPRELRDRAEVGLLSQSDAPGGGKQDAAAGAGGA